MLLSKTYRRPFICCPWIFTVRRVLSWITTYWHFPLSPTDICAISTNIDSIYWYSAKHTLSFVRTVYIHVHDHECQTCVWDIIHHWFSGRLCTYSALGCYNGVHGVTIVLHWAFDIYLWHLIHNLLCNCHGNMRELLWWLSKCNQ